VILVIQERRDTKRVGLARLMSNRLSVEKNVGIRQRMPPGVAVVLRLPTTGAARQNQSGVFRMNENNGDQSDAGAGQIFDDAESCLSPIVRNKDFSESAEPNRVLVEWIDRHGKSVIVRALDSAPVLRRGGSGEEQQQKHLRFHKRAPGGMDENRTLYGMAWKG